MTDNPKGVLVSRADPEIEIAGTLEYVSGRADIGEAWLEDGELRFEHSGNGTEMFWDGMLTMTVGGRTAFMTEDGTLYTADELAIRLEDGTLVNCNQTPGAGVVITEEPAHGGPGMEAIMKALEVGKALLDGVGEDQDTGVSEGIYEADPGVDAKLQENAAIFATAMAAVRVLQGQPDPEPAPQIAGLGEVMPNGYSIRDATMSGYPGPYYVVAPDGSEVAKRENEVAAVQAARSHAAGRPIDYEVMGGGTTIA